jgi:hypothetical protein
LSIPDGANIDSILSVNQALVMSAINLANNPFLSLPVKTPTSISNPQKNKKKEEFHQPFMNLIQLCLSVLERSTLFAWKVKHHLRVLELDGKRLV